MIQGVNALWAADTIYDTKSRIVCFSKQYNITEYSILFTLYSSLIRFLNEANERNMMWIDAMSIHIMWTKENIIHSQIGINSIGVIFNYNFDVNFE